MERRKRRRDRINSKSNISKKERDERIEEHREARERVDELNSQINFGVIGETESRLAAATFVTAEGDDETPDTFENDSVSVHENWNFEQLTNVNWQARNPQLIRERELEEMRMREVAREIDRIDRAIRK